jgi:hypothetical protein
MQQLFDSDCHAKGGVFGKAGFIKALLSIHYRNRGFTESFDYIVGDCHGGTATGTITVGIPQSER